MATWYGKRYDVQGYKHTLEYNWNPCQSNPWDYLKEALMAAKKPNPMPMPMKKPGKGKRGC